MNKQEMIKYVKSIGGTETPEGWNVSAGVYLSYKDLTEIPIQFNIVNEFFLCHSNKLTSLKGCPKEVQGDFSCSNNYLTSLKYCPKVIQGDFSCYNNKLTSLKYSPEIVGGTFSCYGNRLKSLKYSPKEIVIGEFWCDKGIFKGKNYYDLLLKEKSITEAEYLLAII